MMVSERLFSWDYTTDVDPEDETRSRSNNNTLHNDATMSYAYEELVSAGAPSRILDSFSNAVRHGGKRKRSDDDGQPDAQEEVPKSGGNNGGKELREYLFFNMLASGMITKPHQALTHLIEND